MRILQLKTLIILFLWSLCCMCFSEPILVGKSFLPNERVGHKSVIELTYDRNLLAHDEIYVYADMERCRYSVSGNKLLIYFNIPIPALDFPCRVEISGVQDLNGNSAKNETFDVWISGKGTDASATWLVGYYSKWSEPVAPYGYILEGDYYISPTEGDMKLGYHSGMVSVIYQEEPFSSDYEFCLSPSKSFDSYFTVPINRKKGVLTVNYKKSGSTNVKAVISEKLYNEEKAKVYETTSDDNDKMLTLTYNVENNNVKNLYVYMLGADCYVYSITWDEADMADQGFPQVTSDLSLQTLSIGGVDVDFGDTDISYLEVGPDFVLPCSVVAVPTSDLADAVVETSVVSELPAQVDVYVYSGMKSRKYSVFVKEKEPDVTPPSLVSISVTSDSFVYANSVITLTFDEDVKIDGAFIARVDMHWCRATVDGNKLLLQLDIPVPDHGQDMCSALVSGVSDIAGNYTDYEIRFSFGVYGSLPATVTYLVGYKHFWYKDFFPMGIMLNGQYSIKSTDSKYYLRYNASTSMSDFGYHGDRAPAKFIFSLDMGGMTGKDYFSVPVFKRKGKLTVYYNMSNKNGKALMAISEKLWNVESNAVVSDSVGKNSDDVLTMSYDVEAGQDSLFVYAPEGSAMFYAITWDDASGQGEMPEKMVPDPNPDLSLKSVRLSGFEQNIDGMGDNLFFSYCPYDKDGNYVPCVVEAECNSKDAMVYVLDYYGSYTDYEMLDIVVANGEYIRKYTVDINYVPRDMKSPSVLSLSVAEEDTVAPGTSVDIVFDEPILQTDSFAVYLDDEECRFEIADSVLTVYFDYEPVMSVSRRKVTIAGLKDEAGNDAETKEFFFMTVEGEEKNDATLSCNVDSDRKNIEVISSVDGFEVRTSRDEQVYVINSSGVLLYSLNMQPGARFFYVPSGVYFVNGIKVIVK